MFQWIIMMLPFLLALVAGAAGFWMLKNGLGAKNALKVIGGGIVGVVAVAFLGIRLLDFAIGQFEKDLPESKTMAYLEKGLATEFDYAAYSETGEGVGIGPPWSQPVQSDAGVPPAVPAATPVAGVPAATPIPVYPAQVEAAPELQKELLPEGPQRVQCLVDALLGASIGNAQSGSTTWFPRGTIWNLRVKRGVGFFYKNRHWVSSPALGITQEIQIGYGLGRQLDKASSDTDGIFYGTGEWPPSCYVAVTSPPPTVVLPPDTGSSTPPVDTGPCTNAELLPGEESQYWLKNTSDGSFTWVEGGLPEATFRTTDGRQVSVWGWLCRTELQYGVDPTYEVWVLP